MQGQFTLEGKDQIRAIHDYDAGINTRLEIYEPKERGDTIIFRMVEHNDWLKAAGLPPASYLRVEIEFREGLIQRIIATPSAESAGDLARVLGAFHHWAIQAHPQAYKALFTSDGQFNYNRETGVRVVALLRQWRISGRKSD